MTKLASTKTELIALRALCSRKRTVSGKVLAGTDETYFYNDTSLEAYRRIRNTVVREGQAPNWAELSEDPSLSEDTREFLNQCDVTNVSVEDADKCVNVLAKYRKLRGLYLLSEDILTNLQQKRVDHDSLLERTTDALNTLRVDRSTEDIAVHFGANNNSYSLVKKILYEKEEKRFVPTGFRDFDIKNGGILLKTLFLIGGTSGGGKSTLSSQLCLNWARQGERVLLVPLEMSEEETTCRILANIADLDVRKIILQRLTKNEQELVDSKYVRFVKRVKAKGGRYSLFKPRQDMTIEEILNIAHTYGPRIVVVDYISLLKGVNDGDDQWRKLGQVARYCKIWADTNNKIVVLLAQVSEDGKVRYSQAIREHADYGWVFVANKETRENEIINIEQIKGRNAEMFPFSLRAQLNVMRIGDLDQDDSTETEEEVQKSKGKKRPKARGGSSGGTSAYDKDLADSE